MRGSCNGLESLKFERNWSVWVEFKGNCLVKRSCSTCCHEMKCFEHLQRSKLSDDTLAFEYVSIWRAVRLKPEEIHRKMMTQSYSALFLILTLTLMQRMKCGDVCTSDLSRLSSLEWKSMEYVPKLSALLQKHRILLKIRTSLLCFYINGVSPTLLVLAEVEENTGSFDRLVENLNLKTKQIFIKTKLTNS